MSESQPGHLSQRSRVVILVGLMLFAGTLGSAVQQARTATAAPAEWSVTPSPNPAGNAGSALRSVSCTSSSNCVAVGDGFFNGNFGTIIESWDGTTWTVVPSPNPISGLGYPRLNGVSCTGPRSCVAVGDYGTQSGRNFTLIESWNGGVWSITPSPNPGIGSLPGNYLDSVSCTSAMSCVAVGMFTGPLGYQPLIETWNGTAWSVLAGPSLPESSELASVSCSDAGSCMAVGFSEDTYQTLIETWDGNTWSVAPSPSPGSSLARYTADSVSCTGPSSCVVAGIISGSSGNQTLVAVWDGSHWSVATSPDPVQGAFYEVDGLSCVNPTSCVLVGDVMSQGVTQTLVESWNGNLWVSTSPSPHRDDYLYSVSCTDSIDCVAVGKTMNQTLVETGSTPSSVAFTSADSAAFTVPVQGLNSRQPGHRIS